MVLVLLLAWCPMCRLVRDAGAHRDDLELVEPGLVRAREVVTSAVVLVLRFGVVMEGVRRG